MTAAIQTTCHVMSLSDEVLRFVTGLGTGISTQAGAGLMTIGLAAPVNAPALTYFERLFWSQESQNAAAAVTGKTVR